MKKLICILLIFTAVSFIGCEDNILDKYPMDSVTDGEFWKTENDLKLYLTGLYNVLPVWYGGADVYSYDRGTDIIIEGSTVYTFTYTNQLNGKVIVPPSGGGWDWGNVRSVNYFLDNIDKIEEETEDINHYIGEGYFFRAYIYFDLFTKFGGLPLIDKVLGLEDADYLYAARASRTETADFIIADLDRAISNLKNKGEIAAGRINKDIALLFKARVCLYAGTWEKYHAGTIFAGNGNPTEYIQAAADAAYEVINNGNYIIPTDGDPATAYHKLFTTVSAEMKNHPEVMLYKHYNVWDHNIGNNLSMQEARQGMTHQMTEYYLCSDGLPMSVSPLVDHTAKLGLTEIEKDRDPRFDQCLITRGELDLVDRDGRIDYFTVPVIDMVSSAYQIQKWRANWVDPVTNGRSSELPYITFRFAEALLIYAEAKEELGEFDQAVADMTINKIRDRVGMPHMVVPIPFTDTEWLDYGTPISPELQEIRRERTVELFGEGFRFDDLARWRAHQILVDMGRPVGAYLTEADGIAEKYPDLEVNAEGYLDFMIDKFPDGKYGFNPERDYLLPLPKDQRVLNENLDQNPGWGE
jgi:starch-binding outer membrane protein, SusD/RagB family